MTTLSRQQVDSWRLSRHHLTEKAPKCRLSEVVSEVCGLQAQVQSAAELALRARVEDLRRDEVRDALWKERTILRTWCMRGTLHLLASADLPLYVSALRTKLAGSKKWLQETEGVDPDEVEAVTDGIARALKRGAMTREELAKAVEEGARLEDGTKTRLRSPWGILLRPAAYQGMLAFGPGVGAKVTFVAPKWPTPAKEPPTREAFETLFLRFLRCYGPATVQDFARWWGDFRGEERLRLQGAKLDVVEVQTEGRKALMRKRDAEEAGSLTPKPVARLLPSFDPYFMFYSPREAFVAGEHHEKVFSKLAGWIFPTLVVDGRARGVWNHRKRGRHVVVEIELFRPLSPAEKRLVNEEIKDVGEFLGVPAEGLFR